MTLALRLARRELRGGLQGFRIFLACLALGVAAIAAVGMVSEAIRTGLERQGAVLLGGDGEAEFTYRFATDDERAFLDQISDRVSETVDFRSMATVDDNGQTARGLTQVRAVDGLYPLVGAVSLSPEMPLDQALAGSGGLPGAVMQPLLPGRLGLEPGDSFRLGAQDFVLSALLVSYPDNADGGFSYGPRTIVLTRDLAASGLLAEGTLFSTAYRLDLPDGTDLDRLETRVERRYRDAGLRWHDSRRGAPGTDRFVDRIGSFLILIGLAGLAVGGVGVSSAVRAYLAAKTEAIATLKTLGATRGTIFATYLIQIGVMALLGILLGLVVGAGLPLLLAPLIAAQLPIPAEFALYPAPLAQAALYGVLSALIFTLWPLARTEDVHAAALFRDDGASRKALPRARYLVATAVLLAALVGAAVWFTGALRLTLYTAGGIAGALAILVLCAYLARRLARGLKHLVRHRPGLRLALGAIAARGGETTSVVLSLGLGLSVLASVGQIDGNVQAAFSDELPEVAPSFFFVDIQPDQIDGYSALLAGNPAVHRVESAPMLRGIITRINDRPAREVAGGHWVIQGDRGLTYSADLPPGTQLTEGEWWAPDYSGPPLVSFSAQEAAEIGLKLGDTLTVNVLGRDITATITSFRTVNFETAGIGFVMLMNPSALAGAPHSWISTVYADQEAEAGILRQVGDAYANVTAFGVRDVIEQVTRLVTGIAAGIRYGALVTLVTGFLVLIGAAASGQGARIHEAAILKTLGATRARILGSFALRAALLGAIAGVVALAAGSIGGWAVTRFVMEADFRFIWGNAVWIVAGGILATILASGGFSLRALASRPAQVLRGRE